MSVLNIKRNKKRKREKKNQKYDNRSEMKIGKIKLFGNKKIKWKRMFFPFFSLSFTNYSMIWIRGQEYKWYSKWENCIENKNYTQENQCSSVHHKWFCSQQIILFSNESVGCTSKSVSTHFLYNNRKIRKKQKECNLTKRKVNLVILLGLTNLVPKTSLNRRENSKREQQE